MTSSTGIPSCSLIDSTGHASLSAEWEALHKREGGEAPFAHPTWYATWLTHFPVEQARYLAFHDDDRGLVAVIPLQLDGESAVGLGNYKIQDYSGTLVASGWETLVAAKALEWLANNGIGTLRLWGLPTDSALIGGLSAAAGSSGWRVEAKEEAIAPVAELGEDWDQFLSSLPKKHRHELRRKLRNLEGAGAVSIETLSSPDDVGQAITSLLRMMRESHEGKTRFLTAQMESFFTDIGPAMASAGSGRAWRLTLDDREIAILLGFDGPTTRYLYNSGYDPEYGSLAVGLLSKALAMKASIAEGQGRFDFLRGNEEYKRRLGGIEKQILTLDLARG